MPRPLIATIDQSALRHNLSQIHRLKPGAKIWAVVKANGYGHGLAAAMRGFEAADGLALIEPEAAEQLRRLGWHKRILLLEGAFDAADMALAVRCQLDLTIHNQKQITLFEQAAHTAPVHLHLKMNSGMHRLGFSPAAFASAIDQLRAHRAVASITLMTHFANADAADAGVAAAAVALQMQRFSERCTPFDGLWSISNSAASVRFPALRSDWIRPGIMLYGGMAELAAAQNLRLQAAMTLRSELIEVQQLATGDAVGYGGCFVAPGPMKIGVVACGYADGYPRHAPTGTPILVDGIRTRVVGSISMDMITVDLTPIPHAAVGTGVLLWGAGLPIDEVAEAAGTIGYELMCALAPRVRIIDLAV